MSPTQKSLSGLILGALILMTAAAIWLYRDVEEMEEDALNLRQTEFAALPGWKEDNLVEFLPALLKSCSKILALPATRKMGGVGLAGTAADWQPLCEDVITLPPEHSVLRAFMEQNFTPYQILNNKEETGLFTGYYEASLKGSQVRQGFYTTPLHLRPPELVMVDLGQFRDELKGQRIAGKVENGNLKPFDPRADIESGALEGRELELVWVDSAIDAFFLHIQGSGIVEMDDGSTLRVGYAAQNGHPYFAIGKALIERGHVPKEEMSMQAIRSWLDANPDQADEVMQLNASYVFFRQLDGDGPIGAQGVELTAERSLAVDRKWMPLGVPIFLETEVAGASSTSPPRPFRKLMMAQDTGGAIRGPVRGDVFWGYGDHAYEMSGAMKNDGRYWILLPNAVAARINMAAQS
ncbi:MAG: MltA domain-containing protein [Proteobacteria bacterium]|nr:MltA domain-containing protein [Pseudomonadota bacterium]